MPLKKYRKTGETPFGEWICTNIETGETKRASEWKDVTLSNTEHVLRPDEIELLEKVKRA